MTLSDLIRQYAAAEAAAGDWSAVAGKLNAATVPQSSEGPLTSMARTLAALAPAEREPTLAAFAATKIGEAGLQKLASTGLDFAHPLTTGLIESLRNSLPPGVADKLLKLGRWTASPALVAGFAPVTAEQCSAEWLVGADCLLSVNRTNGVLRVSLNVQRDGQQIRLALLTEGQGSAADQALTSAIESAIDAWLQAGG